MSGLRINPTTKQTDTDTGPETIERDIHDIFRDYPPDKKCNKAWGCYGRGYFTEITKGEKERVLCQCVTKQMEKRGIDLSKLVVTNWRMDTAGGGLRINIDDLLKTGSRYK